MTATSGDAGGDASPPAVADAVDGDEVVSLLQDLVAIESPYFAEGEITEFVYEWLDDHGLAPQYHRVAEEEITGFEGRNVVARLDGSDEAAPTLLLNAHVDTVRIADGWERDPLSGRVEDGRLYGQGAADMKAGLAASLVAFRTLAEMDADLRGSVVLTAVVDEEGPFGLGTDQLLRDGVVEACDMAVVPEPGPILAQDDASNPALFLGARGRFLYDVTVRGRPAHGAAPERGCNAVVDAGRLAAALADLPVGTHPKLGSGSVCPLLVDGGSETLSVPDECRLVVDRHVVFGETMEAAAADVRRVVDDIGVESSVDVGFRDVPHPEARYRPYVTDENHRLVTAFDDVVETLTGQRPTHGYFRSVGDFNYLGQRAGMPTVIVGPDGENIHEPGEFVYVDDTVRTAEFVAAAAADLLA